MKTLEEKINELLQPINERQKSKLEFYVTRSGQTGLLCEGEKIKVVINTFSFFVKNENIRFDNELLEVIKFIQETYL